MVSSLHSSWAGGSVDKRQKYSGVESLLNAKTFSRSPQHSVLVLSTYAKHELSRFVVRAFDRAVMEVEFDKCKPG